MRTAPWPPGRLATTIERPPVQLNRLLQRRGVRSRDQPGELADIDPDLVGLEAHGGPADGQAGAHDRRRDRQRAPQRGPPLGTVGLRPEQVDELLTAVLTAGDREQRQQGGGLPGIEGHRDAIALDDG
jgi:hypothetical protein